MTWSSYSSIQNYEFTAFAESALLQAGDHNLSCGDKFVMPDAASVCITVKDNDQYLSGDAWCNENADDSSYQTAKIMDADGAELGNGRQVYAESYHWVSDQHGNWYVLIEIEQEGTGDDYFAFYTGGCYTVPPAGAHLTVHGSCNVKGDWLKFDDLDSGPKPEPEPATGSICGSVFCDTNCDGIDGIDTVEPGHDYVIEAEHMRESGFTKFHGSQASGGQGVKLDCAGGDGWLKTTFDGKTGVYDVTIRVQDENDGKSVIKLLVDGRLVEAVRLDRDSDGGGSDRGGFSHYVIRDVSINQHSEIKLVVDGDKGEFVRIDNLKFEGQDKVVRAPEPPKEGVTVFLLNADGTNVLDANGQPVQTVTDADGMYEFTNVPVGDYRVKFVAPDGSVFTKKDAGADDSRDSDVDDSGVSNVFSVVKDQKTTDIDAGLSPTPVDAVDDTITVLESEGEGDVDINVLANDTPAGETGPVLKVEGQTANVGEWIDLAGGGRVRIDADGNLDFDADGDFDNLNAGESATVSLTYTIGTPSTAPAEAVHLDFNALARGTVVTDQFAANGLTISSANANNPVMIFDSAAPTGGDWDLATSNLGKVLILSEDRDSNDPDDNAGGGTFVFSFDRPADLSSITFLDTEEPVPVLRFFDANGALITTINGPSTPDGGQAVANFDVTGVSRLEVQLKGSGAIDNLKYSFPAEICEKEDTATVTIIVEGENDPVGSFSGRYFCDENDNDVDDNEPGVEGVLVELLDANGNPTGITTTTAADGSYSFANLMVGTYGVRFTDTVSGKTLVAPNVGNDDAVDSDAIDQGNGVSVIRDIVVVAGQDTPDNDAGVEELPGSLSGRYFCDENDNDVDDNEPGVEGVLVELLDANGNPTGVTTTTAADGSYSFANLLAGVYGVRFTDTVSGKTLVAPNVGNDDAVDSDAIDQGNGVSVILGIVVVAGQDTPDNDAGVEEVNDAPTPMDDMGKICANEILTLDVLANDTDADGDPLSIVAVDGQAFDANGQVTLANGVVVSLVNGELVIDGLGSQELIDLEIGESLTVGFTYTVSDGIDPVAANVSVEFCGSAETLEDIGESLPAFDPAGALSVQITDNYLDPANGGAYDILVSGGDARLDGLFIEQAYCLSAFLDVNGANGVTPIIAAPVTSVNVLLADGADPDVVAALDGSRGGLNFQSAAANLDLVNYILNLDFDGADADRFNFTNGVNDAEIQGAIWLLTDGANAQVRNNPTFGLGERADALAIYNDAIAFGEGFEAGEGDVVGLLLDPIDPVGGPRLQPFIIGVEFSELDCLC